MDITKQVKEVAQAPASLGEKKATLLSTLEAISKTFMEFRNKVIAEKNELEASPLAKHPRCLENTFKPFNELGLEHQEYLKKVEEWKQNQGIADDPSETDCLKWKGKIQAIQHIETHCAFIENDLHAVECNLTSLQDNANNEEFHQPSTTPNTHDEEFHPHLRTGAKVVIVVDPFLYGLASSGASPIAILQHLPTNLLSEIFRSNTPSSSISIGIAAPVNFGSHPPSSPMNMGFSFPPNFGSYPPASPANMAFPFGPNDPTAATSRPPSSESNDPTTTPQSDNASNAETNMSPLATDSSSVSNAPTHEPSSEQQEKLNDQPEKKTDQ